MTPTALRSAGFGRITHNPTGSNRHPRLAAFGAAMHHVAGRIRHAPAQPARSNAAGPMWSLLLPSYYTRNPSEEAMPDPDAGPSHRPSARILGGQIVITAT